MGVAKYRNRIKDNKRLWNILQGMKKRCLSPKEPRYKDYGGRGIKICDEWLQNFDCFADWAKSNGYADNLTIERKDVDGDYCPDNCEWITRLRQSYNKRTSVMVTYRGETKCLMDWCGELGLGYDAIHNRLESGWSAEDAFEKPLFDQSKSFRKMCMEHGLNPVTVISRVDKLGWSLEDALNTPSPGRGTNILKPEGYGVTDCKICGIRFKKNNSRQVYCSESCHRKSKKEEYRHLISHKENPKPQHTDNSVEITKIC